MSWGVILIKKKKNTWIRGSSAVNACPRSLTAEQKTQLQLCSSLVAAGGCSLRHSLQKTSGPGSGLMPASGFHGAESPASRLGVGLLLAMLGRGMQGREGRRNQAAASPSAGD